MKALLTLALLLSVPSIQLKRPLRSPVDRVVEHARQGGRWYFAENGHAVYCYGPVKVVPQAQGGLQRVATFCRGTQPMVPLKD